MSNATARFPKTAYARQLSAIGMEFREWVTKYRTDLLEERCYFVTPKQRDNADRRAAVLSDLEHRLYDIALQLEALP